MIRSMTLTMLVVISLASSGISEPEQYSRPLAAGVAAEDSVGVLLDLVDLQARKIDHLELDLRTCRIDSAYWHQRAEDLDPSWWEEVLGDERLWFLIGALASAWAMD